MTKADKRTRSKSCKVCKTVFPVYRSTAQVCGMNCAVELARINAAKKEKKADAKRKRDFYANDITTRKSAAKKACHAYIRYRDRNQTCICCDRPLGKNFDAGHFLESGNNPKIRYNEDNIHAQSVYCNQYQGGNSGDYEARLREKIGNNRVDLLKENRGGTLRRTAEDYYEIENKFKEMLKKLKELDE